MEADKENEVIAMFDGGLSISAIASELGLSNQTVRMVLKSHDRDTSRKPKQALDEDAIGKAYIDGKPVPEILETFKITYVQLYKVLGVLGIPTRKVSEANANEIRLDRAVEMYQAGAPIWSIKQETGISQPTLHSALHGRGIQLRRPRML